MQDIIEWLNMTVRDKKAEWYAKRRKKLCKHLAVNLHKRK